MTPRRLHGLGLLIALGLVLSGVPALAAQGGDARTEALSQTVNWTLGPPSPFAGTRFDGEYVANQRRIYFLGFRTTGDATDGSVWYYHVPTRTYVDTGVDMPVPVSNYQISMLRDASGIGLYIFGGRDSIGGIVTTVQVYRPATNTASVVGTDPWPGTTQPTGCVSLPAMGVATLGNKAYVVGGLSFVANGCADENSRQSWIFDPIAAPGSRWTQGPPLRVPRGYITTAVLGRRIYAVGGDRNVAGDLVEVQTVEAWAPPGGNWNDAAIADLPIPCDEAQAFGFRAGPLANGFVLAGCGQWPLAVPTTHFYDQASNTWSVAGSFNENRRNHAGAVYPRGTEIVIYILGGFGEPTGFVDPITSSELGRGMPSGRPGAGTGSGTAGSNVPTS